METSDLLPAQQDSAIGWAAAWVSRLQSLSLSPGVVVTLAVATGLAVRLAHVIPAGFPLNDGGMFYTMADDLQRSHFLLPEHTSYNHLDIPFAYPPVAFFLAGWLNGLGPWSLLDVVRFLPLAASVLTVPAFYVLARSMLSRRSTAAMIAVLAFAVLPRSFNWMIVGGGLTRSVGLLFALLALHQGFLLFRKADGRRVIPTAILGSLAVMSHPETGWLVGFSLAMFCLAFCRSRRSVVQGIVVVAAIGVLSAPWWATVVARHGLEPLLSAAQSGRSGWYSWAGDNLLRLSFTEEPFLPVLAGIGMVGLVISVVRREFLLPVWLGSMFLLDPRSASTYAMIPLAMLIGIAVTSALPLLSREWSAPQLDVGLRGPWALAAVVALLAYGSVAAVDTSSVGSSPLHALSEESRQAMSWVARSTPQDSGFLVIRGVGSPWTDSVSEWFPTLTKRASLGTVQGYEWLGKSRYQRQQDRYDELQACSYQSVRCLEKWAAGVSPGFSYVYVAKAPAGHHGDCCSILRRSLRASPRYVVLYDGPGATIFGRKAALVD